MFTLAHISDVHLAPMPMPWPQHLLGQRIFGFVNWHLLGRKRHHQRATLDALIAHLKSQPHDHIALSGDIVNIALPQEFARAQTWIEALGSPTELSIVPGNHDAYVAAPQGRGIDLWHAYMASDNKETAANLAARKSPYGGFPYARRFDDVVLIGLASGIPTRPLSATGTLGPEQRAKLEQLLENLAGEDVCCVVMIHHPPLPGLALPLRHLTDSEELEGIFNRHQIHLAFHGHNHRNELAWGEGPEYPFPVVGVPSASMADAQHRPLARYNLYEIERAEKHWVITMRGFGFEEKGGPVQLLEEKQLIHPDKV